jgi:hypothetical protein
MKRSVVKGALLLSMILALGIGSNAMAGGRAAALLVYTAEGSAVGLVDFNQAQFTLSEANQLAGLLQFGADFLESLLTAQAPGVSVTTVVYTPSQLASFGLNLEDADVANKFIRDNLAALGADAYIKAVATKVNPPQGVFTGQNIRLDLYLLASGLGIGGSGLTYVASVEVPAVFIQMLSQLGF